MPGKYTCRLYTSKENREVNARSELKTFLVVCDQAEVKLLSTERNPFKKHENNRVATLFDTFSLEQYKKGCLGTNSDEDILFAYSTSDILKL